MNKFELENYFSVTQKYVKSAIERIDNEKKSGVQKNEHSVLEKLLAINKDYAVIMAFDMLMAGFDTVSLLKPCYMCV